MAADDIAYWNYSFPDIGREDYPLFVDKIIEERQDVSCSKVTLVAHSGAANEATYMAIDPAMAAKVGKLVTLAPCINMFTSSFAINEGDLPAYYAVYEVLNMFGVNSFFDPDFETKIAPICTGIPGFCEKYFSRATNPDLKQGSIIHYKHIQSNSILSRFQDLMLNPVINPETGIKAFNTGLYALPEYDLASITIPTSTLYADSEADSYCPGAFNAPFMNRISGITSDWVSGLDHTGFVKDNSMALTDIIMGTLPEVAIPITAEGLCPAAPEPTTEEKVDSPTEKKVNSPREKKPCKSSDSSSDDSYGSRRSRRSKSKSSSHSHGSKKHRSRSKS